MWSFIDDADQAEEDAMEIDAEAEDAVERGEEPEADEDGHDHD
jgi:hypothetical protein